MGMGEVVGDGTVAVMGSWPFASPPAHAISEHMNTKTLNKILYGHSLSIGTGAGQYRGGLVQQLAYGGAGADNRGREFDRSAPRQTPVRIVIYFLILAS